MKSISIRIFFFSSRRRHTRWPRDWSSDVCSSDLTASFRYLLFRLAGVKKIIVHDHTPGVRTRPRRLKRWYKTVLNRMPLLSCTACFAVSPYVAERLHVVNCVPQKKIHCVTNGIRVGAPLPPRTEKHTLTIVTVARANYYKGIEDRKRVG